MVAGWRDSRLDFYSVACVASHLGNIGLLNVLECDVQPVDRGEVVGTISECFQCFGTEQQVQFSH